MAKDASGSGANWSTGIQSDDPIGVVNPMNSRLDFDGTVTATDMDRATDAREKGRIGILGSSLSYAGSSPRVTSEKIGRDLNPLGRGSGMALVGGQLNLGRIAPSLPQGRAAGGTGSSVNNSCGVGGGCGGVLPPNGGAGGGIIPPPNAEPVPEPEPGPEPAPTPDPPPGDGGGGEVQPPPLEGGAPDDTSMTIDECCEPKDYGSRAYNCAVLRITGEDRRRFEYFEKTDVHMLDDGTVIECKYTMEYLWVYCKFKCLYEGCNALGPEPEGPIVCRYTLWYDAPPPPCPRYCQGFEWEYYMNGKCPCRGLNEEWDGDDEDDDWGDA